MELLYNCVYTRIHRCGYDPLGQDLLGSLIPTQSRSESEYFIGDTSIDIHSRGPTIAKTNL